MNHSDFRIGSNFRMYDDIYRCTDIGTRTIIGIRIHPLEIIASGEIITLTKDQVEKNGWLNGPPYAILETVFDEDDIPLCEPDT